MRNEKDIRNAKIKLTVCVAGSQKNCIEFKYKIAACGLASER